MAETTYWNIKPLILGGFMFVGQGVVDLRKDTSVCLVMPPFSNDISPSLALGLLQACLLREGIPCRVDYANMGFHRLLGMPLRRKLMTLADYFDVADAVFAPLAGIAPRRNLDDLAGWLASGASHPAFSAEENRQILYDSIRVAKVWLEETAERILAMNPRFVGACSMFQQHNAALALLRRLKERRPEIATAMGGPNCMGSAGGRTLRHFPFVDFVFFGEADEIIAEVVRGALAGGEFPLPYGVLRQGSNLPRDGKWPHRLTRDLDSLPLPDYHDFFASWNDSFPELAKFHASILASEDNVLLYLEGSRGCWWGEKHPCTFCGLNGSMNRYRRKRPERIAWEMREIRELYGQHTIAFTDSIMSREAQKELPRLVEHHPLPIDASGSGQPCQFTEIKSNLTEEEIKSLAEIGFTKLQPGIESFSDHILQLMGKGNTAIRHIALLKYARRFGVYLFWNLLYGFPGETRADYEELINLLPLLTHLQPPGSFSPLVYHKNSIYCTHPEQYGLQLIPARWYDFLAPDDDEYIKDFAYTYENTAELGKASPLQPLYDELENRIRRWKLLSSGGGFADRLEMRLADGAIEITDLRECHKKPRHVLTGLAKEICLLCRAPISRKKLAASLDATPEAIDICLSELASQNLLIGINEEYLTLAIDRGEDGATSCQLAKRNN